MFNNQQPKNKDKGRGHFVQNSEQSLHYKFNEKREQPKNTSFINLTDSERGKQWDGMLRVSALVISLLGMYISAQFSVDGFSFQIDDRTWIGWGIALIIIVLQSIWQKFGGNVTLFVIAMTCYVYGITTNVLGIIQNRGGFDGNKWSLVVPIVFGILLEVFPEPVLGWAISGDTSSDPIGKLLERFEDNSKHSNKRTYQVNNDFRERLGK